MALLFYRASYGYVPEGWWIEPGDYALWVNNLRTEVTARRSARVWQVTPSVLVSGQRSRVYIRGWLGESYAPDQTVPVSLPSSTSVPPEQQGRGTIKLLDAATNTTGRIVYDDPFNATVTQTLELVVEPSADNPETPNDEGAIGIFDTKVANV